MTTASLTAPPRPRAPRAWLLPLAAVLTLAGGFLTCGSRERPWGDARIMYEVGEGLAAGRGITVKSEWPPMSHKGADGRIYSQYAIAPSVVSVPGIWLRQAVVAAAPRSQPVALAVTSHLAQALLGALACALLLGAAVRLGASRRAAVATTVMTAVATMVWIYARSPFSEILQATCFTGVVVELLRVGVHGEVSRRRAIALGLWAGALLNAKLVFALSLVGAALWLGLRLRRDRAALKTVALGGLAGFAPMLLVALVYNHLRWGSPLDTGYGETLGLMKESLWAGLWGLLASPGKSVFLYSPPLILAIIALPRLWARTPAAVTLLAAVVVPPVLFYGKFLSWAGDYAWGPRYLVFLVPALMLAVAPWLDEVWAARRRGLQALVVATALGGVAVQVLGSAFYWDHWIRIAMKSRQGWLGNPDRKGAMITDKGGHCDSCFEDMHGHQWLPPMTPVAGHWWLARHVPFGDDWATARADAPWTRYTRLKLDGGKPIYEQVRVDWWANMWLRDDRHQRPVGIAFAVIFAAMLVGGALLWRRSLAALPPDHQPDLVD